MVSPRRKPRYLVIEYEAPSDYDNVAAALEEAKKAHEQDHKRGFAVVELIAVVGSEHKTIVTRVK